MTADHKLTLSINGQDVIQEKASGTFTSAEGVNSLVFDFSRNHVYLNGEVLKFTLASNMQ